MARILTKPLSQPPLDVIPSGDHAPHRLNNLRVAIVHDWLTSYAGSERVLEQILLLFPNAELFTLVNHLHPSQCFLGKSRIVHTSFLQDIPFSPYMFRKLLWLLPAAIEAFDLSSFDLIISSSHAVAKGVLTGPDQLHICYCHSPMRYAWDRQHEYLHQSGLTSGIKSLYARASLHYLRLWDVRTTAGVDHFIANSAFIARRIAKVYSRNAAVIHPPVDVDKFKCSASKGDYYVTASRLVPYKRVDLIVQAFASLPDRRLIVIGDGPQMQLCQKLATPNTLLLGYQPDEALREIVANAHGFIFAGEEDFGISVVEAQATGTPVICYGRGGVLDSVIDQITGIFFSHQTAESIVAAIKRFEALPSPLNPLAIRSQAQQFTPEKFQEKFLDYITARWSEHTVRLNEAGRTFAMQA